MKEVFQLLNKLSIEYSILKHDAVFTCEEAEKLNLKLDGIGCKNLFLKGKDFYYLVILEDKKRLNFKALKSVLNDNSLTFASEFDLLEKLGLTPGSVSPLGIINDKENSVKIIFDKSLIGKNLLCHPNINTSTISISYYDLIDVSIYLRHDYIEIEL